MELRPPSPRILDSFDEPFDPQEGTAEQKEREERRHGLNFALETRQRYKSHIRRQISSKLGFANVGGFDTKADLVRHHKRMVRMRLPVQYRCTLGNCKDRFKIWHRTDDFRVHLKSVHDASTDDITSHVYLRNFLHQPSSPRAPFEPEDTQSGHAAATQMSSSLSTDPPFSADQPSGDGPPESQVGQMVLPDHTRWVYLDRQGGQAQGPFTGLEMNSRYKANLFTPDLRVKKIEDYDFQGLEHITRRIGDPRGPFLTPQIGFSHGPAPGLSELSSYPPTAALSVDRTFLSSPDVLRPWDQESDLIGIGGVGDVQPPRPHELDLSDLSMPPSLRSMAGPRPPMQAPGWVEPEDDEDDDCDTTYSDTTMVPHIQEHGYIVDLSEDIYSKLGPSIGASRKRMVVDMLPELIRAFAIKIGHDKSSQANQNMMYFIHKRHRELAHHLNGLLFPNGDGNESDVRSGPEGGISFHEKIELWNSAPGSSDLPRGKDDKLFVGVDDEHETMTVALSEYCKVVLNSPAYDWFITTLKRRCSQKLVTLQEVGRKILSRLPTGRISKHRAPNTFHASFQLPSQPIVARARLEGTQIRASAWDFVSSITNAVVLISSSPEEVQAATAGYYAERTWPSFGGRLLEMIAMALPIRTKTLPSRILPDKTEIRVSRTQGDIVIDIVGTAYSISECGELLGWVACSMRAPPPDSTLYTMATVSNLPDPTRGMGHQAVNFKVQVREDIVPLNQIRKQCWYKALGQHFVPVIVQGYHLLRRLEVCSGLELPYGILRSTLDVTMVRAPPDLEDLVQKHLFYKPAASTAGQSCLPGRSTKPLGGAISDTSILSWQSCHVTCACSSLPPDIVEENESLSCGVSASETDEELSLGMFSMSSGSELFEEIAEETPAFRLFKRVIRRLVAEFHGECDASTRTITSSPKTVEKGSEPSSSSVATFGTDSKRTGSTRPRRGSGDKEDDDRPPHKRTKGKGPQVAGRPTFFACPFWKMNPEIHWECYAKKLTSISYVKQHLTRVHTPRHYCQVCFRMFRDWDSHDQHVNPPSCSRPPSARLEGISREQSLDLQRRSRGSVEAQWYAIWNITFPRDPQPSSVYVDYDQSEEFASFHEFIQRQGVRIVRDELAASGLMRDPSESGSQLDRAINLALDGVFERFRSGRLSRPAISGSQQTACPRTERSQQSGGLGSSSGADSGVGIGSTDSYGWSGTGDVAPSRMLPAESFTHLLPHHDDQIQYQSTVDYPVLASDGYDGTPQAPENAEFNLDDFLRECGTTNPF